MDYNKIRRNTKEIKIGNTALGGANPIRIQSMTNTDTHDAAATLAQIQELEAAGCEIVRIAVPDIAAAKTVKVIKSSDVKIPLVADIHFDYRIALECVKNGVDKVRINPGNIGDEWKIKEVCDACKANGVPIRIGVNGGSLEKHILAEYGSPTPEALAKSAMYHVSLLEKFDFTDIVISIKSSNVYDMIKANKLVAERCSYPIHIGVTEAGSATAGTIKNAIGIGSLICDGVGDTLRVSLTESPVLEIGRAKDILRALNVEGQRGMDLVCCPTCGRTKIDLIGLVHDFEDAAEAAELRDYPIKVALMGCAVNGPGEAKDADIGIAGGVGEAVLFKKGEIISKLPEDKIIDTLIKEITEMNAYNEKDKKAKNNKGKLKGAKKLALGLFLLFLLSCVFSLIINAYVKSSVANRIISTEDAAALDADCIIILGAGVRDDGSPSHMLEDRLLRGIEVYKSGASEKILMSGDHGREDYDEVNTMKDFAILRGIDSENIFMDHAGFSTYESMYRAKEIFGAKKIIVITQGYHLYRALYIANSLGLDAYGVSSDLRTYRGQEYFSFRETIARIKDFFTVMIRPEPTYLGESIPIIGNGDITNDRKENAR